MRTRGKIERYRDRHAITNEFMAVDPAPKPTHPVSERLRNRLHELIADAGAIIDAGQAADPTTGERIEASDSRT